MHSEILSNQDQSVRLYLMSFGRGELLRHAQAHREIIRRFGRFPYRNAALGRESTPEEVAFLAERRLQGHVQGDRGASGRRHDAMSGRAAAGTGGETRWHPRPTTSP